jgi:hypothetical protein
MLYNLPINIINIIYMENKSKLKYYWLGLIILIVIVVVVMLSRNSESVTQQSQAQNTTNTSTTNTVATKTNPISTSGLIGTWVSSVPKKGMQGSGKGTLNGTNYKINFTGDINLVVQKVENNVGTGTITFSNLCLVATVTTPGKPDVVRPAQCLKSYTEPAVMQINGNAIKYTGPTVLGASISLTGTYTNDSFSGTFERTSTSGTANGTFDLTRLKS